MFNELMLNWSCWAHEGRNFDCVNDWGGICFKPGGFLEVFPPSYYFFVFLDYSSYCVANN